LYVSCFCEIYRITISKSYLDYDSFKDHLKFETILKICVELSSFSYHAKRRGAFNTKEKKIDKYLKIKASPSTFAKFGNIKKKWVGFAPIVPQGAKRSARSAERYKVYNRED
jgi:hypothetical protein